MGIFPRLQIHDVKAPHEIEYSPPAGTDRRNITRIPVDIDMGAVGQFDLPHRFRCAEIEWN